MELGVADFADLRARERQVHSQGGEDGVLLHLFERLGATNRFFVEFGAWDGRHWSNSAHLRIEHGWRGLLMDGDPDRVADEVRKEFITAENVELLFTRYEVPPAFDLLSMDIDGNEYWVWKAITRFRPRVVVIEYNVCFGAAVSKTMPYDPHHRWDKTRFHGASLAALHKLGREKGYTLLHTDSAAPNAFFVDDALLPPALVGSPVEGAVSWDWDPCAEPPVDPGRRWVSI